MEDIYDGMNAGERQLYELMMHYDSEDFKVLPNVLLQKHKEGTNQIDLLVINKKGLFVFEVKDFSGWVYGNEDNSEWTQVFSAGKNRTKKFKFKNPVKQNDNHIKTLKHLLNKNGHYYPIFNVVIFGENATLKDITTSIDVVTMDKAYSVIEKYPEVMISNETINNIYNLIMEYSLVGSEAMDQHIEYAKSFNQSDASMNAKADKKIEKKYSKNSNSKTEKSMMPYILFFLIIIFSLVIITIQPWMGLLLISLFIPAKGRKRRIKFNLKRKFIAVVILFLIAIAFSFANSDNKVSKNSNTEQPTQPSIANNQSTTNSLESSESSIFETNEVSQTNEIVGVVSANVETEAYVEVAESYLEATEETSAGSSTEVSESMSIQVPTQSPLQASIITVVANNKGAVFLGSNISDVEAVLGKPERINNGRWYYQISYFIVDSNNKITGWTNNYNQLDRVLSMPSGGTIDLGSDANEVLLALGSPTEINSSNQYSWNYSLSSVVFDSNWKVIGWRNVYDQLKPAMNEAIGGKIDLSSTRETVLDALGSPTEINSYNQYIWNYSLSSVVFDSNWKVIGWNNVYDQLKPAMLQTIGGKINLGSTREKVLEALGSPTEIKSYNQYLWNYSLSSVVFDSNWKVIGWNNVYDQLKPAMYQYVGGKIDLGSTREKVLEALGSPTEIKSYNQYLWSYSLATVMFDSNWKIIGWNNIYDQLKPAMYQSVGGIIKVGSSVDDVIKALGSPTEISSTYPLKWNYQNSYIQFGNDWKVASWKNNYDQLTKALE